MTTPWYRSRRGIGVVTLYGVLTVAAVAASTGWLVGPSFFPAADSTVQTGQVPAYVYLYAFLGAMAYAFTSVVAKFERRTVGVLKVGLRAIAALPLAAGVFMLSNALGIDATSGQFVAGAAFLVGLYVNLTLRALGGLADRLYGRSTSPNTNGK